MSSPHFDNRVNRKLSNNPESAIEVFIRRDINWMVFFRKIFLRITKPCNVIIRKILIVHFKILSK